jgi:hypothetical protein
VADLKLSKLPERTPVKLTLALSPQLHADLALYADAYAEAYGTREEIADLIPAMLARFLDSDRAFRGPRRKPTE